MEREKHIHSSCGFPAKGEKGKTEGFQVYKVPVSFITYSLYPVPGHSHERIPDCVALSSPRAVA